MIICCKLIFNLHFVSIVHLENNIIKILIKKRLKKSLLLFYSSNIMKKLSFLFIAIVMALVTSCGVTPDVQPTTVDNTLPAATGGLDISFTDPSINATSSVVAASGDNVNVSLLIKKTASGGKPRILRVFVENTANYRPANATPLFEIKLKNKDEQTQTVEYTVSPTSGKVYIHFDVYDNTSTDANSTSANVTRKTLVVNVSSQAQIAAWPAITLGAQANAAGSRVTSATGDIYKVCDLDSNMKYVDITYASVGSPVKSTLMSNPARNANFNLSTVATASDCAGSYTGGGSATYFVVAPTAVNFATADDAAMGALSISNTAPQFISVEVGKVYAFLNGRGKKGLIKVNSIEAGTAGSINIDIKVQK